MKRSYGATNQTKYLCVVIVSVHLLYILFVYFLVNIHSKYVCLLEKNEYLEYSTYTLYLN